jgi:hypothetical protein
VPKYWKIQQGQKTGTIGKPLVGTSIIITDPNSFEVLKQGDAGMILIPLFQFHHPNKHSFALHSCLG